MCSSLLASRLNAQSFDGVAGRSFTRAVTYVKLVAVASLRAVQLVTQLLCAALRLFVLLGSSGGPNSAVGSTATKAHNPAEGSATLKQTRVGTWERLRIGEGCVCLEEGVGRGQSGMQVILQIRREEWIGGGEWRELVDLVEQPRRPTIHDNQ